MKEKDFVLYIEEIWGVTPKDINFYKDAFTVASYEVLEFLGDSYLDFIVADFLIKRFPLKNPGWYTKKRMLIVNETSLAKRGKEVALEKYILIPENSSKEQITKRIIADIMEAVIGAIYMDQGLEICKNAIIRVLELHKINETLERVTVNPVGVLQELFAKHGLSIPTYKLINTQGDSHNPLFTMQVRCQIGNKVIEDFGIDKSKKDATKKAAQKLLKYIETYHILEKKKEITSEENPIGVLQEFLSKKGFKKKPVYTFRKEKDMFHADVECFLQGQICRANGLGISKKEAKKQAAKKVFENCKRIYKENT